MLFFTLVKLSRMIDRIEIVSSRPCALCFRNNEKWETRFNTPNTIVSVLLRLIEYSEIGGLGLITSDPYRIANDAFDTGGA